MIQLTLKYIKSLAGSDRKFRSGFMIHQKDSIISIEATSQNSLSICMKDSKNNEQTITLYFYADTGTFKYANCSCSDTQPCVHTIASLLYILYKKESLSDELMANKSIKMFEAFERLLLPPTSTISLQLVGLSVLILPQSSPNTTQISLSVGITKKYTIKNIETFLIAISKNENYILSKFLTYNSTNYYFNAHDMQIIDLLQDYLLTKKVFLQNNSNNWLKPLYTNSISLPEPYLKRLLALITFESYNIRYNRIPSSHQGINKDIDIDFYMVENKSSYTISINVFDIFFPLSQDTKYIFYNHKIYELTDLQQKSFILFQHYFVDKHMDITNEQLDDFINQVLPILNRIGHVTFDSSISDRIITYPLICKIYIEQIEDNISLRLEFHYGASVINIFPHSKQLDTLDILTRQLEKEQEIIQLLKTTNHSFLENGNLYYTNDTDLFLFLNKILPKLVPLCEIYYSKDFKKTYLRSNRKLETHISYHTNNNLLSLDFQLDGVTSEELYDLLRSIKERNSYYKLSDGSFFTITDTLIQQVDDLDQRFKLDFDSTDTPIIQTDVYNSLYLNTILMQPTMNISYDKPFSALLKAIKSPTSTKVPIPSHLVNILRDYQRIGFYWLTNLANYSLNGILADDMGLGKTIQAIAVIVASNSHRPSLVIVPTSLIYNWEEEIHKFAPMQKVRIIFGAKLKRAADIANIESNEIILTSYGSLKRDVLLYKHTFNYCIIDEAQHIKNPNSQNAITVKQIQSNHKLALTGTPIQNTLTELWSIFDFILPNFLGSYKSFIKNYQRPIVIHHDSTALNRLNQLIQPFILRRLKKDVLSELPDKIETKISINLNKHQKSLYAAYIQQAKDDLHQASNLNKGQRSIKILSILTRLRQICCHPSMFMENYTHTSSKMSLLFELIHDSLEGSHRILIFSQFTSMLSLIRQALDKEHTSYFYLDGSTPARERQKMVHDFNMGNNDIFLISLKAGGTGLNLTGADVVIHYDPWWNPAVENQATDRAHRIGQTKCVQVYRLITAKTIEEKIYNLQQNKISLIDSVIQPGQTFINQLSSDELESLFSDDKF